MAHIAAINQTKLSDNPALHYYVGPTPYHILLYNLKTIVPIQKDVEIGQRQFLSSKDVAAVNAMSKD